MTSLLDTKVVSEARTSSGDVNEKAWRASVNAPTRELLTWVARGPRTYADTMEAWRSSCPRFTVWEDALDAGLVRIDRGSRTRIAEAQVTLTPRGQAALAES